MKSQRSSPRKLRRKPFSLCTPFHHLFMDEKNTGRPVTHAENSEEGVFDLTTPDGASNGTVTRQSEQTNQGERRVYNT